ncbi:biotin--acetyl-CoA-carboxylase ligase [Ochrobactrum sp. MYb15]|nr:biotin--acetyl-CoA-carboxylase ligase [Ochrobactrum sp. MYb19]PRA52671.1 biotin--acetyl-CoA-carboxylase ligase [Ochrobactrum sp. MYb68]PRA63454.1 biotin--acetyl-CoA-carboxylase ligase [Ochrobactrum sp. MYb18]PRA73656.1 biotin--acetyl-CoA-carboxylase ligase [Brucella thiophenivorans]PRA88449.1 biotin--acetyl-CoA-carboxylase ligase [Ochrobactrum sp. MYb14]PRA94713.1 biotin--acetyl-CoA-carboxylase ligase [Ochrobactrum sp. MYb15]
MMLLIFLPCAVLFGLAAMFYSEPVLTLQDDGTKADVIVVPGGDGPPRAAQAARLWKEGRSPLILITGDGDCLFNKQIMVRDGVNPSAILVECQSGSTWQNAYYSVPVMREIQARKALIVTNWYHSRRAIASFRAACPQMHFSSSPIGGDGRQTGFPATPADIELVAKEYVKLGWYLVSGRIFPWDLVPDNSSPTLSSVCAPYGKSP